MDSTRFDQLSVGLAQQGSRRAVLKIVGTLVAALLSAATRQSTNSQDIVPGRDAAAPIGSTMSPPHQEVTSGVAEMKRAEALRRAIACGSSFNCFLAVMAEAIGDCKRTKTNEDCWMCKQVTGDSQDEDCNWLPSRPSR
jgi:hypothetical protein